MDRQHSKRYQFTISEKMNGEHRKFCQQCFEMIHECECPMTDPEISEEIEEQESVEPGKSETMNGQNCECPICMDCFDVTNNFAVTECGHKFHLSCLMKNVSHNGFGCPYCRAKMADEPEETLEDDESVWTEDFEEEVFGDRSLNGFRWMFMREEGEEIPEDDIEEEEEEEEEEENVEPCPPAEIVVQKLMDKRITFEHLVKALLVQHVDFAENREMQFMDERLFGEIHGIINAFRSQQQRVRS
jgi:hypothetical protein